MGWLWLRLTRVEASDGQGKDSKVELHLVRFVDREESYRCDAYLELEKLWIVRNIGGSTADIYNLQAYGKHSTTRRGLRIYCGIQDS